MSRFWFIPTLSAFALACTAADDNPGENNTPTDCVSTEKYFSNDVWGPLLSSNCFQCHNAQGAAKDSNFVLQSSAQTGFLDANFETTREIAQLEIDGTSILLLKPSAQIDHGGGLRIAPDSPEYKALEGLIAQFDAPIVCENQGGGTFFSDVSLMDNRALLRKLTLNLAGRLPTAEELELAATNEGLDQVLDGVMTEEAFHVRLKEVYNDLFLTDRYLGYDAALQLLSDDDYPERRWYDTEMDEDRRGALRTYANTAVAREPLELISYIVRNDKPFTEILTANYILLNPFSARSYGAGAHAYQNGDDPDSYDANDFREVQVPGTPHAGVLSSHMFLNRFPTTDTNVNRHRSRMVYKFFLATDVLKLAERPVDPTQIMDFNPTLYNPACNVCHATIDPVAGAFQNWDDRGRFRPPEDGWNEDMLPPGFGEDTIGFENRSQSLQWLADRISKDERFATAVVHTMYTAMTGQEPLNPSTEGDSAEVAQAKLKAFEAQDEVFGLARTAFIDGGFNLKTVIKALAKSPYLRAQNSAEISAQRGLELSSVGTARLLTPEQLDRKIEAVTGFPWLRNNRRQLLSSNEYRIFYGGIDSNGITTRITEPNGVMASIAFRMANEMSCVAVPHDFVQPQDQRRLFVAVEPSFVPLDENGFEVPGAIDAIKENIRHLHQRILHEDASAQELERTYQLFLETWQEGQAAVQRDELSRDLPWSCRGERDFFTGEDYPEDQRVRSDENFSIRAWMAVTTYMLSDYDFLYE